MQWRRCASVSGYSSSPAVLGVAYGSYKALTQPRIYEASSTIQVHNGASNEYRLDADYDYVDDSQTKMNTEVLILTSDTLLYTVAREMDLANNPDFTGAPAGEPRRSIDDPHVRASVVGALHGKLKVSLIPRTQMMRITYSSLSPKLAADIVNKVVCDYIQRAYKVPVEQTKMVSGWLETELDELKSEVERSQQQMMELQRKLGVLGFDSTHNQLQTSLEELLSAEGTAKIARITAEQRYLMVRSMDASTIGESIDATPGTMPGELNALRSQLAIAQEPTTRSPAPLSEQTTRA